MASTEISTKSARIKRGYEAFQAGDMDTLRSLFTSDIAWHSPAQGEEHFHGVDAVIAEFGRLHHDTDGTFRVFVDEITEGEHSVVVLARATATRGEKTLDRRYAQVFSFRGEQVCESWVLPYDPDATAAFWA
jgi:uncharacterized protein